MEISHCFIKHDILTTTHTHTHTTHIWHIYQRRQFAPHSSTFIFENPYGWRSLRLQSSGRWELDTPLSDFTFTYFAGLRRTHKIYLQCSAFRELAQVACVGCLWIAQSHTWLKPTSWALAAAAVHTIYIYIFIHSPNL